MSVASRPITKSIDNKSFDQYQKKPDWNNYVQTANQGSKMCSVCIAKKCFNVLTVLFCF